MPRRRSPSPVLSRARKLQLLRLNQPHPRRLQDLLKDLPSLDPGRGGPVNSSLHVSSFAEPSSTAPSSPSSQHLTELRSESRSSSISTSDRTSTPQNEDSPSEVLHFDHHQHISASSEPGLQTMSSHPPLFQMGNQQSKPNTSIQPHPFDVTASALRITSSAINKSNPSTTTPAGAHPSTILQAPALKLRPRPATTHKVSTSENGRTEPPAETVTSSTAPLSDPAAEEGNVAPKADTSGTSIAAIRNPNIAAADGSSVESEAGTTPPPVSATTTSTKSSTANNSTVTSTTTTSNTSPTGHENHYASPTTPPNPACSTVTAATTPLKPKERLFGVQSRAVVIQQARSRPKEEAVYIDCEVGNDAADDDDSLFANIEAAETPAKELQKGAEKRPAQDEHTGTEQRKKKKLFHSLSAEDLPASPNGQGVLPVPPSGAGSAPTDTLTNGETNAAPAAATNTNGYGHGPASIFLDSRLTIHDDEGYGSFSHPTHITAPLKAPARASTNGSAIVGNVNKEDDDFVPEDEESLFRAVIWKRPEATAVNDHSGGYTPSDASSFGAAAAAAVNGGATAATGKSIDVPRYPKVIQDRIATIRANQAEKDKAASADRQKKLAAEKSRRMREETEERRRRRSGSALSAIQGVNGGLTAAFPESDVVHAAAVSTSRGSRASDEEEKRLLDLAEHEAKKAPKHPNPKLLDPAENETKRAQHEVVPTNAAVRAKQDIESIKRKSALPMALQRGLVPARGVGLLDQIVDRRPMDVRDMLAPAGEEAASRHFHPGMRKNMLGARAADAESFKIPRKESVFEKIARENVARAKAEKAREPVAKEAGQAPSSHGETAIPSALRDKIAKLTQKLSDKDAAVARSHELLKERAKDLEWLERAVRETARLSCMIDADDMNQAEVEKVLDFAELVLDRKSVGYAPRMKVKSIKENMARRVRALDVPEPDDERVREAMVLLLGQVRFEEIQKQFDEAKRDADALKLQRQATHARRSHHRRRDEGPPTTSRRKERVPKPQPEFHTGMAVAGKLGDYKYRGSQEEDLAMALMRQQLAKFDEAEQMPVAVREQEEANDVYEDSESEESVDETGAEIYAGFGGPVLDTPVVPLPVKVAAPDVPKDSPKAVQMPSPPVNRVAAPDSPKSTPTAFQMPSPRETSSEAQPSERNSPEYNVDMEESPFDKPRDLQVAACRFIVRAEFWNMAGNDSDIFEVGRFHSLSSASARLLETVEKYKCRCWISPEMITDNKYERPSIPEKCYLIGWEKKDAKTQNVIEHDIVEQLITDREQANADAAQLLLRWYLQFIDIHSGEYEMTNERVAEMYQKQEDAEGLFQYSGSMVLNDGTVEEMHVRVKELRTGQTDRSSSE